MLSTNLHRLNACRASHGLPAMPSQWSDRYVGCWPLSQRDNPTTYVSPAETGSAIPDAGTSLELFPLVKDLVQEIRTATRGAGS